MDASRDALLKLDAYEEHYRIPSPHQGLQLFLRRLTGAPGCATHLMHFEESRQALHRESVTFLLGDDVAPTPL